MNKRIFMGVTAMCLTFGMMTFAACAETNVENVKVTQKEANVHVGLNTDDASEEIKDMLKDLRNSDEFYIKSDLSEIAELKAEYDLDDREDIADKLNQELYANNPSHVEVAPEDVIVHILPYLDVEITGINEPVEEDGLEIITGNYAVKYDVIASAETDAEKLVTVENVQSGETVNAVIISKANNLSLNEGRLVEISIPMVVDGGLEELLKIKHSKDGNAYYYDTDVNRKNILFTTTCGLGEFALIVDGRVATVKYVDLDEERTYDATAVLMVSLPIAEKEGHVFKGWKIEGIDGTYHGIFTDDLMNRLHVLANSGAYPIYAYAVFEAEPIEEKPDSEEEDNDSTEEVTIEEAVESVQEEVLEQTVTTTTPAKTSDNTDVEAWIYSVIALIVCLIGLKMCQKMHES